MNSLEFAKLLLARATERNISICPMKLQKLAYYCQGYHLALYGAVLFDDAIEAWEHGPVVRAVYNEYRDFGSYPINVAPDAVAPAHASVEVDNVVHLVFEKYGSMGAWALREQTHREKPWVDHQPPAGQRGDEVIPVAEVLDFFRGQLKRDFDRQLAVVMDCVDSVDTDGMVEIPDSIETADQFLTWARSLH